MKAPALVLAFVPAAVLASACASTSPVPPMPAWTPADATPVAAAAVLDDQPMRVPSDPQDQMRVPKGADEPMRVPREEEPKEHWQASGLYLGGEVITSQPMGDFDGDTALAGPTDLVLVPDLDLGAGAGAYLSYRWYMNELMVQYSLTEHDGSFPGSPRDHDTTFHLVDLNWRHYFWEHSAIQPFGLLGMGISRAKIDNGSTDQATGTVFQSAELSDGISVNVGAGLAVYTLPGVVFYGQGMYRFARYETSNGIDGEFSNTPDIDGDGWAISFGAAIRLLPSRN